MKRNLFGILALSFAIFMITSCGDDADDKSTLNLSITGLEDLGSDYAYEGWLIVDGSPITSGVFNVDANGNLSQTDFEIESGSLERATAFVLTIEPSPDADPAPSSVHILAGNFNSDDASLTIDHGSALGTNFSSASGKYILATPTDGANNNENSGIWFLDLSSGMPATGLSLPSLPNGWKYEGWAVTGGQPVSTGTFTNVASEDEAAPFSGTMGGPPFPGEDFVNNAPSGLSFPTDLSGGTAVISVEPFPDNSPNPFLLKPLVGIIASDAVDHVTYDLDQNLSFPTGTASK